ncbi:hypothetical protein ACFQ3K_17485 [Brucella gallinifaecis]|uniref:Uncharacterized protein n=1 Tax=Brucella gallinifaecis TaxID=215590 RepID=A0A502BIZ8_9HYPH|nr:hypothetical protein [Brucella gallinifaecis]TPF74140.1 hypothetical protein FHY56_16225 [Brucella gallinifaecis]
MNRLIVDVCFLKIDIVFEKRAFAQQYYAMRHGFSKKRQSGKLSTARLTTAFNLGAFVETAIC